MLVQSIVMRATAQTSVAEFFYNIGGLQHAALCVLYGSSGKVHVITNMGDCSFDAYYSEHGNYTTIKLSNPSSYGWISGTFYFLANGSNFINTQGQNFPINPYMVPRKDWQMKMYQYGYQSNKTSFKTKEVYYAECAHCKCKLYNPKSAANSYCITCESYGHKKSNYTSHVKKYR